MRRCFFISILSVLSFSIFGQDLFMPRDIQRAFKKGSRAEDGKPGKNYWQNHAKYNMVVDVTPPNRIIKGRETIVYYNNSPDTLRTINIKLFLNIHKAGAPRNFGVGPGYLTSGVQIDEFTVNGKKTAWPPQQFTNQLVRLPEALLPRDSITLGFNWNYEISSTSNREGMIDTTTYFLAYFYPRVAVYDDYNGWDRMNFMDSHEFYSDFNEYSVTINVPRNYLVWGTGRLQEPGKVLQPAILKRYNDAQKSDEVIRIVTSADLAAKNVTAGNPVNSWTFTCKDVPDVAFGISDHFVWDGASAVVDDATGRRATGYAAYNDTTVDYPHIARFAKDALRWFSKNWPGVPYPYEKTTVFQGYAGMEYPMMANDETTADTNFSRFVAEHEIVHTYFPFYMGTNETRYGMMDEGWATAFEYLRNISTLGKDRADQFFKQFRVAGFTNNRSSELQIPIITPGDAMAGAGMGTNAYGKAALGYLALKDMLGDDLFKKCLLGFMDRWKGKHPLPWDFFNTVNNISGKNLNWFWNNWFFGTGYIDYELAEIKKSGTGFEVAIKNIGGFYAPVDIVAQYSDGSSETIHVSPAAWEKNGMQVNIPVKTTKQLASVQLKGGIFMDADEGNNLRKTEGLKGF